MDNFFRQGKPRKMPLNSLAPVQVPTKVVKERMWKKWAWGNDRDRWGLQ